MSIKWIEQECRVENGAPQLPPSPQLRPPNCSFPGLFFLVSFPLGVDEERKSCKIKTWVIILQPSPAWHSLAQLGCQHPSLLPESTASHLPDPAPHDSAEPNPPFVTGEPPPRFTMPVVWSV